MRGAGLQLVAAGGMAAFVGFASTFAVVVGGLRAVGATPEQAASGLVAVTVGMGACGVLLSLLLRMPITIAWSTPGAALLATSAMPQGGFAGAVGAFLIAGALTVAAGLWRPLGRWVGAIPPAIANAMLAGVLLSLCLAPVQAVASLPRLALPVVLAWVLVGRVARVWAVPAALLAMIVATSLGTALPAIPAQAIWPHPVLVRPVFSAAAAIGIGLPLFIVTMASQNVPGLAVLRVNGYRPAPGLLFTVTGLASMLCAPFGSVAINLAAITAAMCAGPEAHPDPARRMWASVTAGAVYVVAGLLAGLATAYAAATPPLLIEAVAGLALLGTFGSAMQAALADTGRREAAVVAFLAAASGASVYGISGAFWGLVAGGAMLLLPHRAPLPVRGAPAPPRPG